MRQDIGLLILRLGLGGMIFFGHGWGKLMSFSASSAMFPDPLGIGPSISMALATFAEAFCGVAIMLGMFTRFTAIPPLVTMAVAAFIVHSGDPFSTKEKALLYGLGFLALSLLGAGRFSLDEIIRIRRKG